MYYQDNAFRILGTPSNAKYSMITQIFQKLKIRVKAGKLVHDNDYLSPISSIELSEPMIRDAFNKLVNPKIRLQERLFWFCNSTQNDKNALARLLSNDLSGAIQIWETDQNYMSIANLARLYHANCIIKDPMLLDLCLWQKAIGNWCTIIKDGDFWENFIDIEMNSGFEPLASHDEIDEVIKTNVELILRPSINFIQDAIDKERDEVAQRHLKIIRNAAFSSSLISNIEVDLLEPLENKIREFADMLIEKLSELLQKKDFPLEIKKKGCDRAYQYFKNDLLKLVQRLERLAGKESYANKRAREVTASCLRIISISYNNDLKSPQFSEQLLKEAQELAKDTVALEKINEDLAIVEKNAQQEKIWKDTKPIKKAPSLHTINGIGTTLYGWKDYDPATGTYISTLYFVFFAIPLFPIARYRIRILGNNKLSFYKKVPLRTFDKMHIAISIFLIVLCIILISQNNSSNYSVKSPNSYYNSKSQKPTNTNFSDRRPGSNPYLLPQKTSNTKTEMLKNQIESAKLELSNQELELKKLEDKINSYENQIEFYAAKIKRIERNMINGLATDQSEYGMALTNHNHYVDLYNTELKKYNLKFNEYVRLREDTNKKIYEYNKH